MVNVLPGYPRTESVLRSYDRRELEREIDEYVQTGERHETVETACGEARV